MVATLGAQLGRRPEERDVSADQLLDLEQQISSVSMTCGLPRSLSVDMTASATALAAAGGAGVASSAGALLPPRR